MNDLLARWGRPLDASLDGHRSDSLFIFATIALLVIFVSLIFVILWSIFAQRGPARYEPGVGKSHIVLTVLVSLGLFVVVDGTLLVRAATDLRDGFWKSAAGDALSVEVLARQWSFGFRYAGPDGQFGTADDPVVTDEMHVPLGRAVVLHMRSADVIHNLYLPNFRIKQDIVPGRTTQLLFTATRAGDFELGCSQHCGVNHYKMHGRLVVDEPAAFAAWQAMLTRESTARDDARDTASHWGWSWTQP
jgi:cytochrome c oxidase subunit 2